MMISFRKHDWSRYKELIGECSNLGCTHYTQLEAHHIIPLSAGGLDEFDNIIILCRTCHMNKGRHTDWMLHQDKLHKWKDAVDSHLIYDHLQRAWVNNDIIDTHKTNEKNVINDENGHWIYSNAGTIIPWEKENMKSWKRKPETAFCYMCSKFSKTYKFGKIFMCAECIEWCIRSYFETFKQTGSSLVHPVAP